MHPTVSIAKQAAIAAAKVILRHIDQLDRLDIQAKGPRDFVSQVDRQAERDIIDIIHRHYPDHGILGEEGGAQGQEESQWIIDPLDGTTNYLRGFPHFSVSIAFRHKQRLEMGLVYDPLRQEFFVASRGEGANLNGRRIRVTQTHNLEHALLGTGFPARHIHHLPAYLAMFHDLLQQCDEVRRAGSAALDLAYVAAGRLDGFWEIGLSPWDMAAGALLVQEAGGLVGDFSGGHDFLETGNVVAGGAKAFKTILQTLQPHLTPSLQR